MKKILFFAGLAVALASCTSEEPAQVSDSYAIGFSTYVGKATRAGDVNTESLTSFAVYGGTEAQEFNGTAVSKDGNAWTYSPVQYWKEGAKYKFAAVAPAVNGAAYDFATNKLTLTDYTPADDDLIVATTNEIEGKAAGSNTAVALNFKHALSKVQLTFKGMEEGKTLSDVKLTSVSNKGTLLTTYTEGTTPTWTVAEGTADYSYTIDATSGQGVKYLLPQALDAVAVTYKYDEAEHTILIKTADVASWEMGKAYNYNVNIGGDAVGFEVTTADWGTATDLTTVEKQTATVTLGATGATWVRKSNTSKHGSDVAMEIKFKEDVRFCGLLKFDLPAEIKQGSVVSAELKLVTTYLQGDKEINLYEFTETFNSDIIYETYATIFDNLFATENPTKSIASFTAIGRDNKSMSDSGHGAQYQNVAEWTNYIDLTGFINGKDGGKELTFIIAKANSKDDKAVKFATHNAKDIDSVNNNNTKDDTSDDKVECTFKAADLVPQLVITYTKE